MTININIYIMFPNGNSSYIKSLDTTTIKEDNPIYDAIKQCSGGVLKHQAIDKFCELIAIPNLLFDRAIPQALENNFNYNEVLDKSKTHVLIYLDTRFFARQTNESDNGREISNKCLEVATLCASAFDIHAKSINRIQSALNIFIDSLQRFVEAKILSGSHYDRRINKIRVNFTPYLICISK